MLTVTQTGKEYNVETGDIVSHPKDVDAVCSIHTPFLKKFRIITIPMPPSI
jgi:uncharacterized cupin superfamily protein